MEDLAVDGMRRRFGTSPPKRRLVKYRPAEIAIAAEQPLRSDRRFYNMTIIIY
jgi:hypothetical protein